MFRTGSCGRSIVRSSTTVGPSSPPWPPTCSKASSPSSAPPVPSSSSRRRAVAAPRRRSSTRCHPAIACSLPRPAGSRTRRGARCHNGLVSRWTICRATGGTARRRGHRAAAARRRRARDQGRRRRTQRDFDRRHEPDRRHSRRIDRAAHPALFIVDAISSLGSIEFRHDDWQVDVTVSCSQKGLMLPPGLGFNAISEKALKASAEARLPRSYFDWADMLKLEQVGLLPVHAGHQPPVRPERGAGDSQRGRLPATSLRATCVTPRPRERRCERGDSRPSARSRRSIRAC